jgi:hypothetical protein
MTKKAKSHYHSNRAISLSLEFLSDFWQLKLPKIMSFLKSSFIISPFWQIFTNGNSKNTIMEQNLYPLVMKWVGEFASIS